MATTRSRTTDTPKRRAKATTTPAARRTRKPAVAAAPPLAHTTIAERAYAIFEAEGGGDSLQHWLRAERELAA